MPAAIVRRIDEAVARADREPSFLKGAQEFKLSIVYRDHKELTEYVAGNYEYFGKLLAEMPFDAVRDLTPIMRMVDTPHLIVVPSSLEAATAKAINDPETMQSPGKIGFELAILGSEDYAKAIRADVDAYGSVIKAANVKMK